MKSNRAVQKTIASTKPEIIWHSDRVRANETVIIQGDGFADDSVVELHRLDAAEAGAPAEMKWDDHTQWLTTQPKLHNAGNLMFILPESWPVSVVACRIRNGRESSRTVLINAPDPWWMQGDLGLDGSPGGWLRVLGKCLNFGGMSRALIREESGGREVRLEAVEGDCYALRFQLPKSMPEGACTVLIHNGLGGDGAWKTAGRFIIRQPVQWKQDVFNVVDFGAHAEKDEEDSTQAIIKAIKRAGDNGGGIVYFPRGRYRITDTLTVPPFVILKGEGMALVSLCWPERPEPLVSLILAKHSIAVEDLTIYTQGAHYNVITAEDNSRVQRVRIRAYWLYRVAEKGKEHAGRRVDRGCAGAGLYLTGKNVVVTDCDILHSVWSLMLHRLEGGMVCRNKLGASYLFQTRSAIFERNESRGGCGAVIAMSSCGWGLNLYDANSSRHAYIAHNRISHVYNCDHEGITTDDHGTAYIGHIKEARGLRVVLAEDPAWGTEAKDAIFDWKGSSLYCLEKYKGKGDFAKLVTLEDPASAPKTGITLFILGGKGAGQYRRLISCAGRTLEIERPWDVEPDGSSIVSLAKFNGRHILVGNTLEDTGVFQLYCPTYDCIVAENHLWRTSGITSWGLLTQFAQPPGGIRADASWCNQFLDNVIEEGNGWGLSGPTSLGLNDGETFVNIHGTHTETQWECPASRCQIIRRHIARNNSCIRIDGAVEGVLVENSAFSNNHRGIEVQSYTGYKLDPTIDKKHREHIRNSPDMIFLRKNTFENVGKAYSGDALAKAVCEE